MFQQHRRSLSMYSISRNKDDMADLRGMLRALHTKVVEVSDIRTAFDSYLFFLLWYNKSSFLSCFMCLLVFMSFILLKLIFDIFFLFRSKSNSLSCFICLLIRTLFFYFYIIWKNLFGKKKILFLPRAKKFHPKFVCVCVCNYKHESAFKSWHGRLSFEIASYSLIFVTRFEVEDLQKKRLSKKNCK